MRIRRFERCLPFAVGRGSGRVDFITRLRITATLGAVRRRACDPPGWGTGRSTVWHNGLAAVVLALMLVGSWPPAARAAAKQAPFEAACQLPQSELHFRNLPTMGEFSGSQMRFADTDPNYYPRGLGGLSVAAVSATLPISFPAEGSRIRFFYVGDQQNKYGESMRLVACLYFDRNGKAHTLSHNYDPEGNALPIIVSMFTENLAHGIGPTIFMVLRWRIDNPALSQTLYGLRVYGGKGVTKLGILGDLGKLELSDFEAKVFGGRTWAISDSGNETIQSVHAYVDKASIVKRLKQLGYLK